MLIEKYTANWIKDFTQIKWKIEEGLQGVDYSIEHVGSTAVPNLDSKPIIDIDIIYAHKADWNKIESSLAAIGYNHHGNQGINDRDVFKRNGKSDCKVLDGIKHHLYVCPANSKALERHILTRDFLRKNDWARLCYQEMKYEFAEMANQDRKRYAELKELNVNDFIDSIVEKERMASASLN